MTHFALRPALPLHRSSRSALWAMLALLPMAALASSPQGIAFSHHDWELACDNTRTCRMAGYQADGDTLGISVLLTRQGGPNQAVVGEVQIGHDEDTPELQGLRSVNLRINGREWGAIALAPSTFTGKLQAEQVNALLASLSKSSRIEFHHGTHRWHLSDKGASAILLKADDVQGRVGTPGALSRKGNKPEGSVPPALPLPVVQAGLKPKPQAGDAQFVRQHEAALLQALRSAGGVDECPLIAAHAEEKPRLSATRLSEQHMLVSAECWTAAYHMGTGFWVVNASAPSTAKLVTHSGHAFEHPTIFAAHKGRGVGDCVSEDQWTWDGQVFVHTLSHSSLLCKGIAAGGAWELPTLRTRVQGAAPAGK